MEMTARNFGLEILKKKNTKKPQTWQDYLKL